MPRVVGIIPARYKSSRFPGKPLTLLLNKPMVIWVAKIASIALNKENIYVATDDYRIHQTVISYGYQSIMTSAEALTGTDRLYEASKKINADIYVNIQGDEPTLDPVDIVNIVNHKIENPNSVINGMCLISKDENPNSINIPKVITTEDQQMVYMSRNLLPGFKDEKNQPKKYYKQVCIYAFNKSELKSFGEYGRKSLLEMYEDIEILRFLDLKIPVLMIETSDNSLAVDIPEDKVLVEKELTNRGYCRSLKNN